MIVHYHDSDGIYMIGINAVEYDHEEIARRLESVTGVQYTCATKSNTTFSFLGDFPVDTVIIRRNSFEEDFLDLIDAGINIYIVD